MRISFEKIIKSSLLNSLRIDNKLTLNTLSLLLIYAFNFLISLITLPHLIKNYGTLNWGNIVFFQIIINYLVWIIDWSFNLYSSKFISINHENSKEQKKIFRETKTAQLILFLLSLSLSFIILFLLGSNKLFFISFSLILMGAYLQSYWFLNGLEKIYETALIQLFNKSFFASLIILLINKDSQISSYFLFYGISNIITGIICQFTIEKKYKNNIVLASFSTGLNTLKKSSKLFSSSVAGALINSSIPLVISMFLGNQQLGIYNVADRIKGISVQLTHPVSHSIFPRMVKEYDKDKLSGNRLLKLFLALLLCITFISFILINVYIENIISYFSNENIFLISIVLRILLFSFMINVFEEVIINQYMIPNGMYSSISRVKLMMLLVALLTSIPLVKIYGIIGAAIANLTSEVFGLIYLFNKYNRTKMLAYNKQKF